MIQPGFPAIQATIFDNKKICVVKEGNGRFYSNYANTRHATSSGTCSGDERTCPGIQGKNRMCISKNKKCPVTDIHFLPKSENERGGFSYQEFNS